MSTTHETTQQTQNLALAANHEANLEALAAEYTELNAIADPIAKRMDEIRQEFRRLLDYGSHRHGGQTIAIQHNPQFDRAAFEERYPPETHPQLWKHEPDRNAIKQNLAPADIQAFQREGSAKVVIS